MISVQMELSPTEAKLLLRTLQTGRNQIKKQAYVLMYARKGKVPVDEYTMGVIDRFIANVNAQIALQK